MVHPLRGVRCRLRRVSRGRGNHRVRVHGRRFRLRDIRSSPPDVAGSPRNSRGLGSRGLSNRVRRHRAAVDRRSRAGACLLRGRDSRCDPARDRFPSSSVHPRCSPVHPRIAHRADLPAPTVRRTPPIAVRRVPIPHDECSPAHRTVRSRRQCGSLCRGPLHLHPVRPVALPRAGRPRHLPREGAVAEPAVTVEGRGSRGA